MLVTKDAWVSQVSGSDAIKRQSLNVKVPKDIYIYKVLQPIGGLWKWILGSLVI